MANNTINTGAGLRSITSALLNNAQNNQRLQFQGLQLQQQSEVAQQRNAASSETNAIRREELDFTRGKQTQENLIAQSDVITGPDGKSLSTLDILSDPSRAQVGLDILRNDPELTRKAGGRISNVELNADGTGLNISFEDKDGIERGVTENGKKFADGDPLMTISLEDADRFFSGSVGRLRALGGKPNADTLSKLSATFDQTSNPAFRRPGSVDEVSDPVLHQLGNRFNQNNSGIPDDSLKLTGVQKESSLFDGVSLPSIGAESSNSRSIPIKTIENNLRSIDKQLTNPGVNDERRTELSSKRTTLISHLNDKKQRLERSQELQAENKQDPKSARASQVRRELKQVNKMLGGLEQGIVPTDKTFSSRSNLEKELVKTKQIVGEPTPEQATSALQSMLDAKADSRQPRMELVKQLFMTGALDPTTDIDKSNRFINTGRFEAGTTVNTAKGAFQLTGYDGDKPNYELLDTVVDNGSLKSTELLSQEEIQTSQESISFLQDRVAQRLNIPSFSSVEDPNTQARITRVAELAYGFTEGDFGNILGADVTDTTDINRSIDAIDLYMQGKQENDESLFVRIFGGERMIHSAADAIGGSLAGFDQNKDPEEMQEKTDEMAEIIPDEFTEKERMNAWVVFTRSRKINPNASDKSNMQNAVRQLEKGRN